MKTIRIDAFLTWAFVHELAKGGGASGAAGGGSAWSGAWRAFHGLAELGTLVDAGRGDAAAFILEQSDPHPDALAAGRAVAALAAAGYAIGHEALAGDWLADAPAAHRPLIAEAAREAAVWLNGRERQGRHIVGLVVNHAVLGRDPEWRAEMPRIDWARRGNGAIWYVREARREGSTAWQMECEARRNPKTHRYPPGAYRKLAFDRSPVADLTARGDWLIWVSALRRLAASLPPLADYRILGIGDVLRPWDGAPAAGRLVDFP